jgi:hypothetical protein
MNLSRRGFLTGMVAVAAVTAAAALPLPSFASVPTLWGDGEHDDTEALQALLDGKPIIRDGVLLEPDGHGIRLIGGVYQVSDTLHIRTPRTHIYNAHFRATFTAAHDRPVIYVHGVVQDAAISGPIFDLGRWV